jgi:RHS repeat-associated protein
VAITDKGLGQPKRYCLEGNPCDPATGNKIQVEVDYVGSGPFPLRFVRTYNWRSQGLGGNLGPKWRHNYDRRLIVNETLDGIGVFRDDGAVVKFQRDGASWTADADVTDKLEELAVGGWTLTSSGGDLVETYDAAGKLLAITNRAGLTQTLSYFTTGPNAGALEKVTDHFGRTVRFAYTARNHLLSLTDPDGKVIEYDYDASARLGTVAYPASPGPSSRRTYLYEDPSLPYALTGIQDENGTFFAMFSYSGGRVTETKHAGDAGRIQFSYPSPDTTRVTSYVTPTLSAERAYNFETILGVKYRTSITGAVCPTCGARDQTFDAGTGFPTSEVDWNDNKTCLTYNARGLEEVRVEGLPSSATCPSDGSLPADARKITTEWHPIWQLATRVAVPKRITTSVYDTDGSACGAPGALCSNSVQATTDGTGAQAFSASSVGVPRTWTYAYNANGQVLTMDGPRTDVADVTTYTYHPNDDPDLGKRGNLATITNALGKVTQITAYDAHGKPLTIVDPNGLTTALTYDARQRLTSRTVGSELTSYEYDGVGQLTKVTLPDGSFLTYTYDAAHRLTAIQDNLGNRIAYTLDLMGNRTREDVFDPASQLAQTRSRVYSNLNRLTQEIGGTNPAAQITQYGYDNQGNLTQITDPLNRVTANSYDARNRLKQVTDPANGVTGYGYDGLDQLVSVSDPRSNATTYRLDGLGNLAAQVSPDTGTTANSYDAAGNLVSSTDAKGQGTSYSYDALNRVTRILYNQAAGIQLRQVDYAYDQGPNSIGRLSSITETSAAGATLSTLQYAYDPHGRITSETRTLGGVTYTTQYAYDAQGRMTGMTYPSGRTASYGLDSLGRVNRIETTGAGQTQVVVQDVLYHPFGQAKGFTFGNLEPSTRSFDLDGRTASHSLGGATKQLSFDAASRITAIAEQGNPANTASYGYDALDRLSSAVLSASTYAYGYDPVGNRLSRTTGSATDTYSYPAASNRLASIVGPSGTKSYAHDPNGAITGDGTNAFAYDVRGRLVSATSSVGTMSFQVNAAGQRVRKTSSLGDTVFHYDAQGRLLAESSPAGTPLREYLWLDAQPVAVAVYGQPSGGCPASPTLDSSNTFVAFARRERMEVHSGRPGERGWEWGLGTNTRDFDESARADLDWVSGKPYGFLLTYDGAGNARVVVRDGATELFGLSWTGGMDVGNALRFMVRSPAGIGAGNFLTVHITSIDGEPVSDSFATAGDDAFSQVVRVYAGSALQDGYSVEGMVTFTFTRSYPPRGNKLDFTVTAGTVTCQGQVQAGAPTLYYVHADHLNTPRAITDDQQRVVWRWENTEPFGKSPPEEDPDGDGQRFEFPLRFPGQYFDAETGLFYNYYRDYDPQTGRYVQSDPIGLAGGVNTYLYVGGNPLSYRDPFGLQPTGTPRGGNASNKCCNDPCCASGGIGSYLQDVATNFGDTNAGVWGITAPVGWTLVTAGATARTLRSVTLFEWALAGFGPTTMGAATFTALETGVIVVGTAAYNFGLQTIAFEGGVLVGSVISAIPTGQCRTVRDDISMGFDKVFGQ